MQHRCINESGLRTSARTRGRGARLTPRARKGLKSGVSLVLMVEDDVSLAATVSKFLQRHGYDVCEAVKCQEAEGLFRARRPDVVLTDYQLPDGTGIELLGKLK